MEQTSSLARMRLASRGRLLVGIAASVVTLCSTAVGAYACGVLPTPGAPSESRPIQECRLPTDGQASPTPTSTPQPTGDQSPTGTPTAGTGADGQASGGSSDLPICPSPGVLVPHRPVGYPVGGAPGTDRQMLGQRTWAPATGGQNQASSS
jgi:hypothetical protein